MTQRIIKAQETVANAREALIDTARELQQRLQPKTLVRDAWESAKVKGADIAEDAVDAVKRRPVASGGIIAAIAMFLAREPIKDGVSRMVDAMTSDKDEGPPPKEKSKPPVRKRTAPTKRSAPRSARKTETK
ncbi:MAG: hypothetical protein LH485_05665 [Sphingomonas bacterium]|nr:hypothetical protein [Sphingomonas bacterium]